jgi:glutaredoxin
MKKIIISIITIMLLILPINAKAESNEVTIYMFRSTQCNHCEDALEYLNENKDSIPEGVKLKTYQVYQNSNNIKLLEQIQKDLNFDKDDIGSIPLFIIGEEYIFGYSGPADIKKAFNLAEEAKNDSEYKDIVKETISKLSLKDDYMMLDEIFSEPSKVATMIVFGIFGAIVLGFGAMIIFSRKN